MVWYECINVVEVLQHCKEKACTTNEQIEKETSEKEIVGRARPISFLSKVGFHTSFENSFHFNLR